ncbi:hypothetical protein D3C78_1485940 [compost metagenome]
MLPKALVSVLLTSLLLSPNACSLSLSISTCSCGVSGRVLARTALRLGFFAAAAIIWSRITCSSARVVAPLACNSKVKPSDWPKPSIAGGLIENTWASRILAKCTIARLAIASAVLALPERKLQSFRLTKAIPAFCPLPLKPKPLMVKMVLTLAFSSLRK